MLHLGIMGQVMLLDSYLCQHDIVFFSSVLQLSFAIYRVAKKWGHRLTTIILSNLNRFKNCSLEDFLVNL